MRQVSPSFEARYAALRARAPIPHGAFRTFSALPRGARILAPAIVLAAEISCYDREKADALAAAGIDVSKIAALQAQGVTVKIAGHAFEGAKTE